MGWTVLYITRLLSRNERVKRYVIGLAILVLITIINPYHILRQKIRRDAAERLEQREMAKKLRQYGNKNTTTVVVGDEPLVPVLNESFLNGLRVPQPTGNFQSNYSWLSILIYVDSSKAKELREYSLSIPTVECYSELYKYDLIILDHSNLNQTMQADCAHFLMLLFRKHCVAAMILSQHPEIDWLLVLDGDVGVVNPMVDLQRYVNQSTAELIFYERFFDWEIASGNYLAKNTPFSRLFLKNWAAYERVLPDGSGHVHSWDNGALQIHLLKTLLPELGNEINTCMRLWLTASNWETYHSYVSCVKVSLGARRRWPKIDVLRRAHGWVIDRDITHDRWCSRMFMFHGWKLKYLMSARWPLQRLPSGPECDPLIRAPWPHRPGGRTTCNRIRPLLIREELKWAKVFMKTVVYHAQPDIAHCWPDCDSLL